jgi:universal stress protein E
MIMTRPIRQILVAVKDVRGSNASTLRKAAQLARALDAKLELFHAMTEPVPIDAFIFTGQSMKKFETDARLRCLRRLESLAAPLRRNGLAVTTAADWDFPAHEALIRRARRTKADLIVAQQHGRRHIAPMFLRYTDWELLRHSPVPVLLVKTGRQYDAPRVLAAIDPSHAFAKTARLDAEILHRGARIAAATRGQLHVVHTYVPTLMDMSPVELASVDSTAQITAHAAKQARTGFDKTLRAARLGQLAPERRHLLVAHAVDAIPALARKLRCDLVVMGAVSRSGLKRLAIGNTAERLLDDLPCDLLIVKPRALASHIAARPRGPQRIVMGPPAGTI